MRKDPDQWQPDSACDFRRAVWRRRLGHQHPQWHVGDGPVGRDAMRGKNAGQSRTHHQDSDVASGKPRCHVGQGTMRAARLRWQSRKDDPSRVHEHVTPVVVKVRPSFCEHVPGEGEGRRAGGIRHTRDDVCRAFRTQRYGSDVDRLAPTSIPRRRQREHARSRRRLTAQDPRRHVPASRISVQRKRRSTWVGPGPHACHGDHRGCDAGRTLRAEEADRCHLNPPLVRQRRQRDLWRWKPPTRAPAAGTS